MLLQRKPKKNDSAVNGCVWAQHVCEDVRVECEKCCALSRIFCLFTGYFMRTESKRKRLSKRNPTSLFTCSFAHGHWFISHKNRKAFVCTLYRYIITDPLENVEPTREKTLLTQWRSVHSNFTIFSAIFRRRERHKSTSLYHRQPNKKRNPAGFFSRANIRIVLIYIHLILFLVLRNAGASKDRQQCAYTTSTSNVDGEGGADDGGRTQSSLQQTGEIYSLNWVSHSLISTRTWSNAPC